MLRELLATRDEHARLLGYDDWPDYDAEVKMVGSASAIDDFIHRLSTAAQSAGMRDREVLVKRLRADRPDANSIDAADASYYSEQVRRESFHVDSQESRQYFDAEKVKQGLLDVTSMTFPPAGAPRSSPADSAGPRSRYRSTARPRGWATN